MCEHLEEEMSAQRNTTKAYRRLRHIADYGRFSHRHITHYFHYFAGIKVKRVPRYLEGASDMIGVNRIEPLGYLSNLADSNMDSIS